MWHHHCQRQKPAFQLQEQSFDHFGLNSEEQVVAPQVAAVVEGN
jgi:hypothetical protein